MKTTKDSMRKIVSFLNNVEEEGGFWLPNIQRTFVWNEEQICRLYDSILREYPISTLLIWKTRSEIRRRKFIDNYSTTPINGLQQYYAPSNDKAKCLVLDGQQRLQSLYIGLRGSYNGKELYLDILSGEVAAPDEIKYIFKFIKPDEAEFPFIKLKDLVYSQEELLTLAENIITGNNVSDSELKNKIVRHVSLVYSMFRSDDNISYQIIDSIENSDKYKEDDVVEIFIRANSGGTSLSKSDLLFSLLSAAWDTADSRMEDLLTTVNRTGFKITRDFVLKTFLCLLDKKSRYEVSKFREIGVRESIEAQWDNVTNSIKAVLDFVRSRTFIQCYKALPSYLGLIPIIYYHYKLHVDLNSVADLNAFIIRTQLTQAFSGTPDNMIDNCVNDINNNNDFIVQSLYEVIRSEGKSLSLTDSQILEMGYGSKTIHLLFNYLYKDFNYTPMYDANMPQIDHIFPQSLLKSVKEVNPQTGRDVMKYKEQDRNQLSNCMLLSSDENGAGNKWDIPPSKWFADKDDTYLMKHLIPQDRNLWLIDNYEQFIEARKYLLITKIKALLD